MKIAIITYDEYINIPYIKKYENLINQYSIEYDIFLWDRRGLGQKSNNNIYIFSYKTRKSKISKIAPFFKWRKFILNKLKIGDYDKVIVLTTLPAILLIDKLLLNYKNNYIFDFRDYTYEKYSFYKFCVNKIIENSNATFISSRAFMNFLNPSKKIVITHNITNQDINLILDKKLKFHKMPIVIGFVGGIRYYDENVSLVKQFSESELFTLKYIGKVHPGNDLELYCKKNNITNVFFYPEYINEQKVEIYKDIDIINAVYGSETLEVQTALPNKLYDCLIFRKPIIVSQNTYLSDIVKEYNLGLCVDIKRDNVVELLNEYINNFDEILFEIGCNSLLDKVVKEERYSLSIIKNFFEFGRNL